MIRSILSRFSLLRVLIATGVITASMGALVATSTPALASSSGCTVFHRVKIVIPSDDGEVTVTIPTGTYCFGVNGHGDVVNFTTGSFSTAWIYNATEIVRVYNADGANYLTYTEPVHYGYSYGLHDWTTGIHGTFTRAQGGRMCGTLLSEGIVVATACEGIS